MLFTTNEEAAAGHMYADLLLDGISRADVLAAKSISKNSVNLSEEEYGELDATVRYFIDIGYDLDRQIRGYLEFLNDQREGYMFFAREKRYRYSTFEEAAKRVYDAEYMESNMIGLALAKQIEYIERMCERFYRANVKKHVKSGGNYLEIGPGHGFGLAYNYRFLQQNSYMAVDLSDKSIEMSRKLLNTLNPDGGAPCIFNKMDFFDLPENSKFDFLVMSEVLEHVEQPMQFLMKARRLLNTGGVIYAVVPMNSPLSDHIYLFTHPNEIIEMVNISGLAVTDFFEATHAAKYGLDSCHKLRLPTMAAMFLSGNGV